MYDIRDVEWQMFLALLLYGLLVKSRVTLHRIKFGSLK